MVSRIVLSRIVVSRIVLASTVALFGIGSSAAPVEAKGAFGGHAGFAFGSGLHVHGPSFAHLPHVRAHAIGIRRFAQHRNRAVLTPSWAGFDDAGAYSYYLPDDAVGDGPTTTASTIPDGTAPPPGPVMVYRPGCRSQKQTVPSEAGGTREITITRCY